jgi:hypothetical protein
MIPMFRAASIEDLLSRTPLPVLGRRTNVVREGMNRTVANGVVSGDHVRSGKM